MHRLPVRLIAPLVVVAMMVTACGGTTTTSPSIAASTAPSASASTAAAASPSGPATVPPGGPVEIRWFCCLGGGDAPAADRSPTEEGQVDAPEHQVVTRTHLHLEGARQAFSVKLVSGNPPDIVGPLGVGGASAFEGQWLDLQPYVDKSGIDLSQYDQAAVNLYKAGGQGLLGIPFAIYPSELYYQPTCSTRPSSSTRPPSTATSTRCRTARWSTGTTTRFARSP